MNITLRVLGSEDLHEEIISDIEHLVTKATSQKLKPMMLVVGKAFVEVGAAQALIQELDIKDWNKELDKKFELMSELVRNKILLIYQLCESKGGKFGTDPVRNIDIFFDPEEPYLTLYCVDPTTKAKGDESKTKDGFLICSVSFPSHEILVNFYPEIIN